MLDLPPPSVRPRLKSADLTGDELSASTVARLSREVLERVEALESAAAKASDVHDLRAEVQRALAESKVHRDLAQAEREDAAALRAEMRRALAAQKASSRSTSVWLRSGLTLLAVIGAAAPLRSDTLQSNPTALGPYGAIIVAVLAAIGHAAKPKAELPPPHNDETPPT
jgi:uncharacterized protein involved in type VI secretion and phage assembly